MVTLTFLLALSSVEGSSVGSGAGGQMNVQKGKTGAASVAPVQSITNCVAPPPIPPAPSGGGFIGPSVFTFSGANTTCTRVTPSVPGPSLANFAYTLNATKPLFMTTSIDINRNGTLTVPNGTTFSASVGSQKFAVYETLQIAPILFTIPSGSTTFNFQVSVPNPYRADACHFNIVMLVWSDGSESSVIGGNTVPVNLDAQ
jgi:hypothetical protein